MAQTRAEAAASLHVQPNIDHPIAAPPSGGNFLRLTGAVPKHNFARLVLSWSVHPSPGVVYYPRMHLGVFQKPCEAPEPAVGAHGTGQLLEHS